nr:ankyrin repeat domain-containing protein [uncultured Rhodoferax sp.]
MKRLLASLLLPAALVSLPVCHAGSYEDFFRAIDKDNASVVESLLRRGFDPNTVNPHGVPALLISIKTPAPRITKLLMGHQEIKVERRNPNDESALMLAAFTGDLELCKSLLALDADVNKPGWTPLHYAATNAHTSVMQLLLDHFAYIDASSPNGTTPLMMAAMYGNSSAVKLLLESGADPNLKNDKGLSALEFALQAKKEESAAIIAAFIRARRPQGVW